MDDINYSFYPQQRDKFFRITKIWFSFVRPPYPNVLWDL